MNLLNRTIDRVLIFLLNSRLILAVIQAIMILIIGGMALFGLYLWALEGRTTLVDLLIRDAIYNRAPERSEVAQ